MTQESEWIDYNMIISEIHLHRSNAQRQIKEYREIEKERGLSPAEYGMYNEEIGKEIALMCLERWCMDFKFSLSEIEEMEKKEEFETEIEIPIPKTVDEAVKTLAKIVSKEDRDYLLENGAISMHDSLGRWIRNEWGLWADSELKNELEKKGFEHPDDMSNYIIEEFIKYWNNKV